MALAREEYLLDKWGRLRAMLGWKREPGQNWYARRMLTNKWKVLEYVEGSRSWLNMLRGVQECRRLWCQDQRAVTSPRQEKSLKQTYIGLGQSDWRPRRRGGMMLDCLEMKMKEKDAKEGGEEQQRIQKPSKHV